MKKDKTYYKQLDILAKAFYNYAFREGPIEDYHAERCPIGNKEMETINRFGVNRLGYLLDLILSGEVDKLFKLCSIGALGVSYFDPIDLQSNEVKQMEKISAMLGF